jgi:hypothetical protein
MKYDNKFINTAKIITLALVLSFGVQFASAQWSAPGSNPPAGNTPAPLNVGSDGQVKDGGLTLGYTLPSGTSQPALIIPTGRLSVGVGEDPVEKVDVSGNVRATGFCIAGTPDACITAWPSGGGGMPVATENGQTIRRNNLGAWVVSNAIYNNATNIGIGPDTGPNAFSVANPPMQRLDVNGNARFRGQIYDSANSPGSANYILTKNASNLPVWAPNSSVIPSGTTGQTLRSDGNAWIANSTLVNNGTSVGINTTPSANATLDVNGQLRVRGGNPGANKVLTSNSVGLATWETPAGVTAASSNTHSVCGLVVGKTYLAIVYGSASSNNGGNSETYIASATVNGVTASINIGNSHNGGAISIPVVAVANESGCLTANVSNFRNSNGAPSNGINGIAVVG